MPVTIYNTVGFQVLIWQQIVNLAAELPTRTRTGQLLQLIYFYTLCDGFLTVKKPSQSVENWAV